MYVDTGDRKYIKHRFNPLPVGLFRKKIQQTLTEIEKRMQVFDDNYLHKTWDRIYDENTITLLNLLYDACYNLMVNRVRINNKLKEFNKKQKPAGNLETYKKLIEQHSGIRVETPEDLLKLGNEIERLKAKYLEHYQEEAKPTTEGVTFNKIVMSIFDVMNYGSPEMRLVEFIAQKELAEAKSSSLRKQIDGIN